MALSCGNYKVHTYIFSGMSAPDHNKKNITITKCHIYDAKVLTSYQTSALRRQVAESVYINKIQHGRRINNTTEGNMMTVPQLTIEGDRSDDV